MFARIISPFFPLRGQRISEEKWPALYTCSTIGSFSHLQHKQFAATRSPPPHELAAQSKTNTSRKEKLGTRLTMQACLFHDTHIFSITLLPDIQEKTRAYSNNCSDRLRENKPSKKSFCLALHRALLHSENITLMPCLHAISNKKEEDGGLWFLWLPRWATIQDIYQRWTAGMPEQIKLEFTLLHRN